MFFSYIKKIYTILVLGLIVSSFFFLSPWSADAQSDNGFLSGNFGTKASSIFSMSNAQANISDVVNTLSIRVYCGLSNLFSNACDLNGTTTLTENPSGDSAVTIQNDSVNFYNQTTNKPTTIVTGEETRTTVIEKIIERVIAPAGISGVSADFVDARIAEMAAQLRSEMTDRTVTVRTQSGSDTDSISSRQIDSIYDDMSDRIDDAVDGLSDLSEEEVIALIVANSSSLPIGTAGYVLQSTGTSSVWVATSTLGFSEGSSQWDDVSGGINFAGGNVGIGTTTPPEALSVSGNGLFSGNVTASAFYGDGSNLTGITSFSTTTTRAVFSSTVTGLNYATSTGVFSLAFGFEIPTTASTTEWSNKVSSQWDDVTGGINYAGNVGIGNTNPAVALDILGSAPVMRLQGDNASIYIAASYVGSTEAGMYNNADSAVAIYDQDNGRYSYGGGNFIVDGVETQSFLSLRAPFLKSGDGSAASPSMTFTTDTGVGFWRPGTSILAVSTAGTERMRIDASGNVGIGTTTPQGKLHLYTASATGAGLIINGFSAQSENLTEWQSNTGTVFSSVNETGVIVAGDDYDDLPSGVRAAGTPFVAVNGNFSFIGGNNVTDATRKFTRFAGAHFTNSEEPLLAFILDSITANTAELYYGGGTSLANSVQNHRFYTATNATTVTGTERVLIGNSSMVVNDAANAYNFIVEGDNDASLLYVNGTTDKIGIGTTTPGAKLQIDTGAAATKGLIVKGFASQSANLQEWQDSAGTILAEVDELGNASFGATNPVPFTGTTRGIYVAGNNAVLTLNGAKEWKVTSNSAGHLTYRNETDNVNPFEIKSTGEQGIRMGSSWTAVSSLDVANTGGTNSQTNATAFSNLATANVGNETRSLWQLRDAGTTITSVARIAVGTTDITAGAVNGFMAFGTVRAGTMAEAGRFTSAGNFGIGTTTPGYALTVAGDVSLTGALRAGSDAGIAGYFLQSTGSGVQWVATSTLGITTFDADNLSPLEVGFQNTASGATSTAFGYQNVALQPNAQLFGMSNYTSTTGTGSVAMGILNNSTGATFNTSTGLITGTPSATTTVGIASTAVGIYNRVVGARSTAVGLNNVITSASIGSVAIGEGNIATGPINVVIGGSSLTSQNYSIAIGYQNTATGNTSGAFGWSNSATGLNSYSIGHDNTTSVTESFAVGRANNVGAVQAYAFGEGIVNNIATSVMIGPTNTAKATILSTGELKAQFFNSTSTTATSTFGAGVTVTGNLGIGTTTPSFALTVGSGQMAVSSGSAGAPGITFWNDSDTGIYNSTGNQLDFAAGGVQYWRIAPTGAFINTNSASFVASSNGTVATPGYTFSSDYNSGLYKAGTNNYGFSVGGANVMTWTNGNVGIGTSSPSEKLSVTGNGLFSGTLTASSFSGAGTGLTGLTVSNFSTSTISQWTNDIGYITSSGLTGYVPYTGATGGVDLGSHGLTATDALFNGTSGFGGAVTSGSRAEFYNVGNTHPTVIIRNPVSSSVSSLLVRSAGQPITLDRAGVGTWSWVIASSAGAGSSGNALIFRPDTAYSGADGVVAIQNAGLSSVRWFVQSASGDNYTLGKLHLGNGTADFTVSRALINTQSAAGKGLVVRGFSGQSATLQEWQNSAGGVLGSIGPSGGAYFADNVGIGTTTPGLALVVVGNAQFTGITAGTFSNDLSITSDGTLTTLTSDQRLKENIVVMDSAETLEKLMQLKPATFDWKSDGTHDLGLIAQEVEEIFPELVFTNRTDGYKGINYSRLPALLVSGMQEINGMLGSFVEYVEDGVAYLNEIVVKRFTAKQITVQNEDLYKTGVTIYDQKTGEPICMFVFDGKIETEPGACEDREEPEEDEENDEDQEQPSDGQDGGSVDTDPDTDGAGAESPDPETPTEGDTGSDNSAPDAGGEQPPAETGGDGTGATDESGGADQSAGGSGAGDSGSGGSDGASDAGSASGGDSAGDESSGDSSSAGDSSGSSGGDSSDSSGDSSSDGGSDAGSSGGDSAGTSTP